jgi:hypothetical protein
MARARISTLTIAAAACLAAAVLTPATAVRAEITEVTEDFRTYAGRDAAFTTALWDTAAGELRLPAAPLQTRGALNTLGTAYAMAPLGAHLLVADGSGGLVSVDPADPDQPTESDQLALTDQARAVAVSGAWAWAAVGNAGLQAVDASNPAALVAGGTADCPGFAQGVVTSGGWAYVAQGASGLAVFDLAAPGAPVHTLDVAGQDFMRGVATDGTTLLAADGSAGLKVYSLATAGQPAPVDTIDTPGVCQGAALRGGYAFLADGASGLQVVDLAAPGGAALVTSLSLAGTAMSVTVAGDTLLVAAGNGGLHLVDITDPVAPVLVGTAATANWAYQAVAAGGHIWLADGAAGVRGFTADPFGLDEDANEARSLNLAAGGDPVTQARLAADFTDSASFFLSGDGGATWQPVPPDGSWLSFDPPAVDVRWRALLKVADGWPGPVVRSITLGLDQAVSHAVITSVGDVPDDDGGRVRLRWQASRHDAADGDHVVTEYSIYRRIDAGKLWPDGEWEYLLTVPADREAEYAAVAPTLHDATPDDEAWSVFFVRTRTSVPGVFFDSRPDSGQSVNDLRPAPPTGFLVDRGTGDGTDMQWHASLEPDFAHFRIYRSAVAGVPPGPATLLHVTTGTSWRDETPGWWYYDLTVVDTSGRESLPAAAVSGVPGAAAGLRLGLPVPNPANPATHIRFTVPPGGARVRLTVHDARGRLVRVLCDERLGAGEQALRWDGRDDVGRDAASGVYTVRLAGAVGAGVRKLTLVR